MLKPEKSLLICTLPRSGSWLLADAIERTGIAGRPREFFEPAVFEHAPGSPGAAEQVARAYRKGTTDNGVFAAKLHWRQFLFAERVLRAQRPGAPPPSVEPPEFSFAAIEALENLLIRDDVAWQRYFEQNDIEPLVIHYESL